VEVAVRWGTHALYTDGLNFAACSGAADRLTDSPSAGGCSSDSSQPLAKARIAGQAGAASPEMRAGLSSIDLAGRPADPVELIHARHEGRRSALTRSEGDTPGALEHAA